MSDKNEVDFFEENKDKNEQKPMNKAASVLAMVSAATLTVCVLTLLVAFVVKVITWMF